MKIYLLLGILAVATARPDVSHLVNQQHSGYNYQKPLAPFPPDQDKYPSGGSTVTVIKPTTPSGYNYNKPNVPFVLPTSHQQSDVQITEKPFSTQGVISTIQQQVTQQKPINAAQQVFSQNAANFQQQVNQFNPTTTAQQVTQRPITTGQQFFTQNTVNIPQQVSTNRPISTVQQDTQRPITTLSQQVNTNRPTSAGQQVFQNTQNVVNIPQQVKPQRPISTSQQQTLTQTSPQTFSSSQSTTVKPVNEDNVYDYVNYDEVLPSVSPSVSTGPTTPSFISSLPTISGFPSVPSFSFTGPSTISSIIPNVISQSSQFFPSSQTSTPQPSIAQDEIQPSGTPTIPSFSIPTIPGFSNAPTIPPIASSGVSFLTSLVPNVASQSVSQFFPSSTTPSSNQFVSLDETQPSVTASIPSIPGFSAIPGISQSPAIFTSFIPNFSSQTPSTSGSTTDGSTQTTPSGGLSTFSSFIPSFLNQGSSTTAPATPSFPSFSQSGVLGTITSFLPNAAPSTSTPTTTTGGGSTATNTKALFDIPSHQYNVPNLSNNPESLAALTLLSQAIPSIVTQTVTENHKQFNVNNHHGHSTINPTFSANVPTKLSHSTTRVPSYSTNLVTSNPSIITTHSTGTPTYGRLQTVQPSQYSQELLIKTKPNYFIQDQSASRFANEINSNYYPSSTQKPIYSQTISPANKASQFPSKTYDQFPSSTASSFSTSVSPAFFEVTPAPIRSSSTNNDYLPPYTGGSSTVISQSTTVQPTYIQPVQTNAIVPSHTLDKDGYHYKIPKTSFGF